MIVMGRKFVRIILLLSVVSLVTGCTGRPIRSGLEGNAKSNSALCTQALHYFNPPRWDNNNVRFMADIREAKRRGFTPETCAVLVGRSAPPVGGERQGKPKSGGQSKLEGKHYIYAQTPDECEIIVHKQDRADCKRFVAKRILRAEVRAKSSRTICLLALVSGSHPPEWDYKNSYAEGVRESIQEANRRRLSPETCAALLKREDIPQPKSIAKSVEKTEPDPIVKAEPKGPAPALVRRIQRGLAQLGYDPGPADGVLGPKTRAAIRAFEAREGLPVTGAISESLEAALRSARPVIARKTPPVTRRIKPRRLKLTSSGSGFIVSSAGHILTNEHVVKNCREVRVTGAGNAMQVATDEKIDLALLKLSDGERPAAKFRGGRGIRTGDDIIVAGYPLQGLLASDLGVTKGIVSNVAGLWGDRRFMQITAPVQPGNSGGPVLDNSGNVVGVVVRSLSHLRIAEAMKGKIPQNVNFAISQGSARAFLDVRDVPYNTAPSDKTVPTADIAAKAKGYTVLIECWR